METSSYNQFQKETLSLHDEKSHQTSENRLSVSPGFSVPMCPIGVPLFFVIFLFIYILDIAMTYCMVGFDVIIHYSSYTWFLDRFSNYSYIIVIIFLFALYAHICVAVLLLFLHY